LQEPDFYENEFIYDDIEGLDEMLLDVSLPPSPPSLSFLPLLL
jgi:hypothetical protein